MNKLFAVILLVPLLMGFDSQDEEEGGMGGTGHSSDASVELPSTPEVPELMDEIPMGVIEFSNTADLDFSETTEAVETTTIDVISPEVAE